MCVVRSPQCVMCWTWGQFEEPGKPELEYICFDRLLSNIYSTLSAIDLLGVGPNKTDILPARTDRWTEIHPFTIHPMLWLLKGGDWSIVWVSTCSSIVHFRDPGLFTCLFFFRSTPTPPCATLDLSTPARRSFIYHPQPACIPVGELHLFQPFHSLVDWLQTASGGSIHIAPRLWLVGVLCFGWLVYFALVGVLGSYKTTSLQAVEINHCAAPTWLVIDVTYFHPCRGLWGVAKSAGADISPRIVVLKPPQYIKEAGTVF